MYLFPTDFNMLIKQYNDDKSIVEGWHLLFWITINNQSSNKYLTYPNDDGYIPPNTQQFSVELE